MTFVTWTYFELPDSVLFSIGTPHHVNPEYDSRLIDAVRSIVCAPGHVRSTWGRVRERPEKVILVSSWKSEDSFTALKATLEYLQYWTILGDISSVAPVEQQIKDTFSWPVRLNRKIDIFSVSLPSPVSDDTRAHLKELNGLQKAGGVGLGKQHLSPYDFPPTKVWLLGTQDVGGTEVEMMLHICWWGSEKKEKDFKEYLSPRETRTTLEKFKNKLREAGALDVREEHCDFMHIGTV